MASKQLTRIDLTTGPYYPKLIRFLIPEILADLLAVALSMLQTIVIGQFAGSGNMAAVGVCSPIISVLLLSFSSISVGAGILMSRSVGSNDEERISQVTHTTVLFSAALGLLATLLAELFGPAMLRAMHTPEDILGEAILYIRVYCAGGPFYLVFNFLSALMWAYGDSSRSVRYTSINAVLKVSCTILFVGVLRMGVLGAGLAICLPTVFSAVQVIVCLARVEDSCRLDVRKLHMNGTIILQMLQIGLPAAIQDGISSAASAVVQSGINSFSTPVVAGYTAASNASSLSCCVASVTWKASQNASSQLYGAGKVKQVWKVFGVVVSLGFTALLLGLLAYSFSDPLLGLYVDSSDPAIDIIRAAGKKYFLIVGCFHCISSIIGNISSVLRSFGRSWIAMVLSMVCQSGLSVLWIRLIFPRYGTLESLYLMYPVIWSITVAAGISAIAMVVRKILARSGASKI